MFKVKSDEEKKGDWGKGRQILIFRINESPNHESRINQLTNHKLTKGDEEWKV